MKQLKKDFSNRLAIIILNYNGAEDTIECIKSLKNIEYPYTIFLVDNGSQESDTVKLKDSSTSTCVFIEVGKNLGYAGGNNIGIKEALRLGYKYICVLNNDTILPYDFITPCITELNKDSSIGFISPAIVFDENGLVQVAGAYINPTLGKFRMENSEKSPDSLPEKIYCDYVSGACLICKSELLEKIGLIPEAYFLFFEETEWCLKAKRNGYKNICFSRYYIRHKGSISINKVGGLQFYLMHRNRIAFMRRNTNNRFLSFCAYKYLSIKQIIDHIRDKNNDNWKECIAAYKDGWANKVDLKKYPFIILKDEKK